MNDFEQGPIRPPSEAESLLLRFNRHCPWNRCSFCPVYKGSHFSRRSVEEIKADIQCAADAVEQVQAISRRAGRAGSVDATLLRQILGRATHAPAVKRVAIWMCYGSGNVFLQDADALFMKTPQLVECLRFLRQKLPTVRRITTYSRSRSLRHKTAQELRDIRKAGLDRVHVGLESGSDQVLEMVRKGAEAEHHIEAGKRVVEAGLELSEYVMPGLGGAELWREHALQTARVLSEIKPHFIRLRTLVIPPGSPLAQAVAEERFVPLDDDGIASEIRLFLEKLEGFETTLASDHIINLLPQVQGKLPDDKPRLLQIIDDYLKLSDEQRLQYRLGRRTGLLESVEQLSHPRIQSQLELVQQRLGIETQQDLEEWMRQAVAQFI